MVTMEASASAAVNFNVRMSRQLKVESGARLPLSKRENFEAWKEAKEIAADPNRKTYTVDEAFAELER